MPPQSPEVIVVGAGVAGLTAAFRLRQLGATVTVLEKTDRIGGKTASVRRDGFIVNTGATVLAGSYEAMLNVADEIGIGAAYFTPDLIIGLFKDGSVHELRGSGLAGVIDFARTPLLSVKSKLSLVKSVPDLLRSRTRMGYADAEGRAGFDTETVASYCDRRLTKEICDHLLDPVLGGIFIVEGAKLSVADLWFTVWKVLLGGLLGYRGGIDTFARSLAEQLSVRTSATVSEVTRSERGARVSWEEHGASRSADVDGVVLTAPAPQIPHVFPEIDPTLKTLLVDRIEQANLVSVRIGLSRRPMRRALLVVAGTGQLGGIATVSYEHNLSPGSAPEGKGLIGVLPYHEWVTPRLGWSDADLVASLLPDLERVEPGITELIEFTEVTRWVPGALKLTHGTQHAIADICRHLDADDRVQLAGDYTAMPSVNGSIVSGEEAAGRLATVLKL